MADSWHDSFAMTEIRDLGQLATIVANAPVVADVCGQWIDGKLCGMRLEERECAEGVVYVCITVETIMLAGTHYKYPLDAHISLGHFKPGLTFKRQIGRVRSKLENENDFACLMKVSAGNAGYGFDEHDVLELIMFRFEVHCALSRSLTQITQQIAAGSKPTCPNGEPSNKLRLPCQTYSGPVFHLSFHSKRKIWPEE